MRDSGCSPETLGRYPTISEFQGLVSAQQPPAAVRTRQSAYSRESRRLLGAVNKSTMEQIVGLPMEWVIDNDYVPLRQAALEGGLVADSSVLRGRFMQLSAQLTKRLDLEPSTDGAAFLCVEVCT